MKKWLQDFAYRISISWWMFVWQVLLRYDCVDNSKFPVDKSGNCKPGKIIANGISNGYMV